MSRTRKPWNGSAGDAGGRCEFEQRSRAPGDLVDRVLLRAGGPVRAAGGVAVSEPEGWSRIRRAVPRVRDEGLPLAEVLERRDVRAVGDRCVGDPKGRGKVEHLLDGVLRRSTRRWSAPAPCGRGRASDPPSTRGARPWRRSRATAARSRTRARPARRWRPRRPGSGRIGVAASVVRAGRGTSPGST